MAHETIDNLLLFALMAAVPLLLVVGTSFAKAAVVLGVLRNGLGTPGIPPASVVTALALVLTIFIMGPVFETSYAKIQATPSTVSQDRVPLKKSLMTRTITIFKLVRPLFAQFLQHNSAPSERTFFQKMSRTKADPTSLRILLPAFASTELQEALNMAFLLLLPFLLVDLVCANVLLAMGQSGLNPTTVALPFKILLFIAADGWHLLLKAIISSYGS